ncbi:hypothetical protein R1flu_024481 [Riccia fluitans]|uniref:Uncharacterized protein n=1 Tax=Riccia fluitans TaxID=41844 RepID=A0ABD1XV19_9MARC
MDSSAQSRQLMLNAEQVAYGLGTAARRSATRLSGRIVIQLRYLHYDLLRSGILGQRTREGARPTFITLHTQCDDYGSLGNSCPRCASNVLVRYSGAVMFCLRPCQISTPPWFWVAFLSVRWAHSFFILDLLYRFPIRAHIADVAAFNVSVLRRLVSYPSSVVPIGHFPPSDSVATPPPYFRSLQRLNYADNPTTSSMAPWPWRREDKKPQSLTSLELN